MHVRLLLFSPDATHNGTGQQKPGQAHGHNPQTKERSSSVATVSSALGDTAVQLASEHLTPKDRNVQFHEPKHVPSDAEAVLEWGLNTPFSSQDKPPLAIAMVVTVNGVRSLKRFRLVIAQKSKLRLTQEVTAALASHSREHRLTASSFFPCSIDREYLYGYAGDGYRSPLWLCASHNGSPVLVHRLRGSKMYFHQATKDRRILLIPGIHYFDAHRLQPLLLQAPALQVHMRESSLVGPEGAGEQVDDPSSDEEQATTHCK